MAKVRTQIQLERRQYERLKRLAADQGKSLSAVIRDVVDGALGTPTDDDVRKARLAFVGAGRDVEGKRDVARKHDRHLYGSRR